MLAYLGLLLRSCYIISVPASIAGSRRRILDEILAMHKQLRLRTAAHCIVFADLPLKSGDKTNIA